MTRRVLSAYEQNYLRRFGINPDQIWQYGEMPVEYITGNAAFLGQIFKVTKDILIPRVETEELVELIGKDLKVTKSISLVDVGTGSGAIGLSLANFCENHNISYKILLTDLKESVLSVAQENTQGILPKPKHGQINLLVSDLLSGVPAQYFDIIVANLPYIPSGRLAELEPSVRDFEPVIALDGGKNGLQLIEQLLIQAKDYLKPGGKVYLELDDTHSAESFVSFNQDYQIKVLKDSFGKNRFGILTRK